MSEEFLENLKRIFVIIRFNIKNNNNLRIINAITKQIQGKVTNDELCKIIADISPELGKQLIYKESKFIDIENKEFLEKFLIESLNYVSKYINNNEYDMAYEVVAVLHALPDMVTSKRKVDIKSYWKIYVEPFEKKFKCKLFSNMLIS